MIAIEDKKEDKYIIYSENILNIFRQYGDDLSKIMSKRTSHIDDLTIEFIDKTFGSFIKDEKMINAIKLIIDSNLIDFIKVIFKNVIKNLLLRKNMVEGVVNSALPLNKKDIEEIEKRISKKINLNVKLLNVIDQELMGGVTVRVNDYFFDGSIKGLIHDIKKNVKYNL